MRQILADVDEAEAQANLATSEPRGHLRVLVPPAFAVHQIAKHLPRFRADFPHVSIELVATGPVETVDESFDISIIISAARTLEGDFIARRLARSEVIVCASPDYLDRRGRPQHPRELHGPRRDGADLPARAEASSAARSATTSRRRKRARCRCAGRR